MSAPFFFLGLLGSIILVTGAAWSEGKDLNCPMKSVKNWLFAIGACVMVVYSLLNYLTGTGSIFFVFLQAFIIIASIMMMLNTKDKTDLIVMTLAGAGFIVWSLKLSEGYATIIFILGFVGIGLGYTLQMNTVRREAALIGGSLLIAIFSSLEANWIFFWLNIFFAIFSAYHMVKILVKK